MDSLLSSVGTSQILQVFIVGFLVVVGWAALWRKNGGPPRTRHQQPEWLELPHRNYYGRRRIQVDPNSEQQIMLREFNLMPKNATSCAKEMRDYLRKRKMPEHQHIAPESILETTACRALVTPRYKNGDILNFINKREVDDGRKLDLIMQIAQGVAYLHSLGIVHGNLYPANVLVKDNGDIVVTDAGIYTEVVKLMLLPSGRVPIPQSADYKSRRDLNGDEVPTKSSDVYAFASTCYAIMTSQTPFSEISNPYGRFRKIAHPDGHTALQRPSSISPTLWGLLMKCWSPDPTQRLTMNDVVHLLTECDRRW